MYSQYWKLDKQPFENDSNPEFFFRSRTHQADLLKLQYLVEGNRGAGLLCGGTGSGKTYLTRLLLQELDEQYSPVVFVYYPFLTPTELVAFIAAELGADEQDLRHEQGGFDQTLRLFQDRLHFYAEQHRHPIIVIDEAHLIEEQRVFQTLQMLLNYREDSPFTLIISGQQSLLNRLTRLPELNERIGVKSLIHSFSREETAQYVAHRLRVAGLTDSVFDDAAIHEIHELSGGVPRRINRIADLSLLVGFADGMKSLTTKEVDSVAEEIGLGV